MSIAASKCSGQIRTAVTSSAGSASSRSSSSTSVANSYQSPSACAASGSTWSGASSSPWGGNVEQLLLPGVGLDSDRLRRRPQCRDRVGEPVDDQPVVARARRAAGRPPNSTLQSPRSSLWPSSAVRRRCAGEHRRTPLGAASLVLANVAGRGGSAFVATLRPARRCARRCRAAPSRRGRAPAGPPTGRRAPPCQPSAAPSARRPRTAPSQCCSGSPNRIGAVEHPRRRRRSQRPRAPTE